MFDKINFPTLYNNPELAYFDSAASTQTHQAVIDSMNQYYCHNRTNVHRGDYKLSVEVSNQIDIARSQVADLINAKPENIIFTSGATEGLNIVAEWCKHVPVVIITEAEHSANILPWLAQGRTVENGRLKVLPITTDGYIDLEKALTVMTENQDSVLSIITTSNVTGLDTPYERLTRMAHNFGIRVCLDACQTVGTHKLDIGTCNAEWVVFSAHKMYGPTGIGALYCGFDLNHVTPLRYGGGTVHQYDLSGNIEFYNGPMRHEPGTPNIAGIIGMGVASEWINYVGYEAIEERLGQISKWLNDAGLYGIPALQNGKKNLTLDWINEFPVGRILATNNINSFDTGVINPGDLGAILGANNVAVRTGRLCAHPLVNKLSKNGVMRLSWGIYNTEEDCIKLVEELCKATEKLTF